VSWDAVYKLVKQIPRGRVLTYGALAKALRLPGGARTAGRAMGATPKGQGIPWHRVLGANGKILIREPYSSLQRKLLESEGVEIVERRVKMKQHMWTPRTSRTSKRQKSQTPKNPLGAFSLCTAERQAKVRKESPLTRAAEMQIPPHRSGPARSDSF